MLRGLLTALALVVTVSTAQAQVDAGPIKIGIVDLDQVVARSSQGQALGARLQAFQEQAKTEGDIMAARARDLRQQIAEGGAMMSDQVLGDLQKQFEDAQIALRRFQDEKQREGQKMQDDGLRAIEEELQPVFESIRDQYAFDLILNRVPGVVIMAGERVDITQLVLDAVNSAAP